MSKILLVDDDLILINNLRDMLVSAGFTLDTASSGEDAQGFLKAYAYDLLILDWNLPDVNGLEILRSYRQKNGAASVLMLTGRSDVNSKEIGLDSGADDYLTKPIVGREFLARVRALLRRSRMPLNQELQFANLRLDPSNKCLLCGDKQVTLQRQEYEVLELLMKHPNEIFSADAIMRHAWPSDTESSPDTVRTLIYKIRKKIEAAESGCTIATLHRIGYTLKAL
jgi:DNA-binding response OmpR family regulator